MAEFADMLNQIGQVLGTIGGNLVSAINTAGAVQSGNLPHLLAGNAALWDDPAFRSQVGQPGFLAALRGGLAGGGFPQIGPDPNVVSAGYGNEGQLIGPTARTNLPPLSPYAQAEQAKAMRDAKFGSMSAQDAIRMAGQEGVAGPIKLTIPTAEGNVQIGGGTTGNIIPPGWTLVHKEGHLFAQGPRGELKPIQTDPQQAGPVPDWLRPYLPGQTSGDGTAPPATPDPTQGGAPPQETRVIPLDDAARQRIREGADAMVANGQMTPEERDQWLNNPDMQPGQGNVPPPAAAAPQGAPTPPQTPSPQAAPTPQLQPGHVAPGDIKAKSWGDFAASQPQGEPGTAGYPSPAFVDPTTAPQAAPTPPRAAPPGLPPQAAAPAPAGPRLPPPGIKLNYNTKTGATSVSLAQPSASQSRVPAVSAREMSNMSTAAQAARQALDLLAAGSQHDLTIMGKSTGFRPGLAGPVQGTGLKYLSKVSDQPLAVEEANLRAAIDHAKTGITAIFGQRITKDNKDFIEALLPDASQPTGILEAHLKRLALYYDQQVQLRETLQSLTPQQRDAFNLDMFHRTMMDIPAPPPPQQQAVPPLMDLR